MIRNESLPDRWSGSVTLHDVASEAGVHPSTASRALDPTKSDRVKESTRQRIVEVAERLGYRPDMVARGLQSGRTGTVGVVVADLGNTFVTPLLHGIAAAIEEEEMLSVVAESRDDHARLTGILDHMFSRRVDGIVVIAARTGDQAVLEAINRLFPVVLASRPLEDTPLHQVTHDNEEGGRLVAQHLKGLGHQTVAQLEGPADVLNFPRRARGFREIVESEGMTEVIVPDRAEIPNMEEGQRLTELLLETSTQLPTAVFAHNDLMAIGALTVLRARGLRVPEDMSLVGYNDMPLIGQLSPPLTSIRYNSYEVGRRSGEMMIELLSGNDPENVSLDPAIVSRGSSRRM